jgi:hypothetical protein
MPRVALSVLGAFLMVVALAVPTEGADSAPVPPRDSVVGSGFTRNFFFIAVFVDAESDALGGNPSGRVSFRAAVAPGQYVPVGGPVTCLSVAQNRAHIGFVDEMSGFGPIMLLAFDGGIEGGSMGVLLGATDCLNPPPIGSFEMFGGFTVFDAPSKDQCKHGGWSNYTDPTTLEPFRRQTDCILFALGVT